MYVNKHACTLENKNYQNQSHAQSFKTKKKKKRAQEKTLPIKCEKFALASFVFQLLRFFIFLAQGGKANHFSVEGGNNLAHLFLYILRNNKPTGHKTQATKWKWFKAHENYFLGKVQQNNCNVLLDFVFSAGDLYNQVLFHGRAGSAVKRPIFRQSNVSSTQRFQSYSTKLYIT